MAYLHIEKGQDQPLLEKLLEYEISGYAYEEIRDRKGARLVNLGFEAGLVGMYEAIRTYGVLLSENGQNNPFEKLPQLQEVCVNQAYTQLEEINNLKKMNVVVMGNGNVSQGVQEVLNRIDITPKMLTRDETPHIANYLPTIDILINATLWQPPNPPILEKNMLHLMKKTALIADISCDLNGAIQTCIPTTWSNPTYAVNGITHLCIDNLPSAIPQESSKHLSKMILPHILEVAKGKQSGVSQLSSFFCCSVIFCL